MYKVKVELTRNHVHLYLHGHKSYIYFYDEELKNIPFDIEEEIYSDVNICYDIMSPNDMTISDRFTNLSNELLDTDRFIFKFDDEEIAFHFSLKYG